MSTVAAIRAGPPEAVTSVSGSRSSPSFSVGRKLARPSSRPIVLAVVQPKPASAVMSR
ncbi:MAG: hypothetical protein NTV86_16665 [Planctomycetota bacterium]|nr:hypothetical protein [Planctomycetota bacterium]